VSNEQPSASPGQDAKVTVDNLVMTDATFDSTSWHDNFIYGLHFDAPDASRYQFWIAPATLVFHNVTDLAVRVHFGTSGYQQVIHQISIGAIRREPVANQKICLDRPYFAWSIDTNWPDGEIEFGATGYTQTLLSQPVLCNEQQIEPAIRNRLLSGTAG
jgi:hypothetical protein